MSEEIVVRVASYGPNRSLMLTWFDPVSDKKKARSAHTTNRREAERAAALLQAELEAGNYRSPSKITWADFRTQYEGQRLATLSEKTRSTVGSALNWVENTVAPGKLAAMTTHAVADFMAKMRARRTKESTLSSYCRALKAALRWGKRMGLLRQVPEFIMPDPGEAKGRAITSEEYERLLAAIPKVRPHDAPAWQRFITGAWLSGLRRDELFRLSWDQDAPFAIDVTGKTPVYRIDRKAQKGRRSEVVPVAPDFAAWLLKTTPETERTGPVFRLPRLLGVNPIDPGQVGAIVAKIGRKAGIVVARDDDGSPKFCTCHDLRRSFAVRWSRLVPAPVLQKMMRHASFTTTAKFYLVADADDLGADILARFRAAGNSFGNSGPQAARNAGEDSPETIDTTRTSEKV